jgi:phospholipid-binding lipoprotein MlaA
MPARPDWLAAAVIAALVATGCATAKNPRDPLEPLNRAVFKFNDGLDRYAIKPAAKGYQAAVPPPVRSGINNVFANFRDVTTTVNNLLQGKVAQAASDAGRVVVNTTVGLGGVFDVATPLGLDKHEEDFGQTLAVWGMPRGPYLVLPLFGPSSVRDGLGLIGDYFTDPQFSLITHSPENWIVFSVRIVNFRANLLDAGTIFDEAALDRYTFLRDYYLQRRASLIYDGIPPYDEGEDGSSKRKTLKEMEEELELDEPLEPAPPTPPPL